jgi:DNA-directed RNA polymerase specialized sigma24 family protein
MATDQQLVGWLTGRHPDSALGELLKRHGSDVHRAALRVTGNGDAADDVCQAVFLLLVRKSKSMSRTRAMKTHLERMASMAGREWLRNSGASRPRGRPGNADGELSAAQMAAITAAAFGNARTSVDVLAAGLAARMLRARVIKLLLLLAAISAVAALLGVLLLRNLI